MSLNTITSGVPVITLTSPSDGSNSSPTSPLQTSPSTSAHTSTLPSSPDEDFSKNPKRLIVPRQHDLSAACAGIEAFLRKMAREEHINLGHIETNVDGDWAEVGVPRLNVSACVWQGVSMSGEEVTVVDMRVLRGLEDDEDDDADDYSDRGRDGNVGRDGAQENLGETDADDTEDVYKDAPNDQGNSMDQSGPTGNGQDGGDEDDRKSDEQISHDVDIDDEAEDTDSDDDEEQDGVDSDDRPTRPVTLPNMVNRLEKADQRAKAEQRRVEDAHKNRARRQVEKDKRAKKKAQSAAYHAQRRLERQSAVHQTRKPVSESEEAESSQTPAAEPRTRAERAASRLSRPSVEPSSPSQTKRMRRKMVHGDGAASTVGKQTESDAVASPTPSAPRLVACSAQLTAEVTADVAQGSEGVNDAAVVPSTITTPVTLSAQEIKELVRLLGQREPTPPEIEDLSD